MKQILALSAGDGTLDVDVDSFDVNIAFDSYNEVEEITIPDEALEAEENSADSSQQPPAVLGTSDWTGMTFDLNGDTYQIPFAYADNIL